MSKQSTLQIRIDEDLKAEAEALFSALGLSTSEAVRLFIAQSLGERRLPFTPRLANAEGGDSAFGKLRHYARPDLTGEARSAWLKQRAEEGPKRKRNSPAERLDEPVIVDATVLLHYVLDDDPRPSAKARRIVRSGAAQAFPETIVAMVAALESGYRVPRSLIGTVVTLLADDVSLQDGTAIRLAARLYGGNRLGFGECLLCARNVLSGYKVETFNRALAQATM